MCSSLQGGDSGLAEGAGRALGPVLPEVSGAEPSRAEQRREGARNQPQGEGHGAAEEGEPGETAAGNELRRTDERRLKP